MNAATLELVGQVATNVTLLRQMLSEHGDSMPEDLTLQIKRHIGMFDTLMRLIRTEPELSMEAMMEMLSVTSKSLDQNVLEWLEPLMANGGWEEA